MIVWLKRLLPNLRNILFTLRSQAGHIYSILRFQKTKGLVKTFQKISRKYSLRIILKLLLKLLLLMVLIPIPDGAMG